MPKTVIEKVPSTDSSVTVFKFGGTLGFHEKDTLSKLFQECEKRGITRIVMDFSELTSLGGGCAKIIREKAENGGFSINIAGASATTRRFLQKKEELADIQFSPDIKEALAHLGNGSVENVRLDMAGPASTAGAAQKEPSASAKNPEPVPAQPGPKVVDEQAGPEALADRDVAEAIVPNTPGGTAKAPGVICLGLDPPVAVNQPEVPSGDAEVQTVPEPPVKTDADHPGSNKETSNRELKKKLIQYSTLLSITSDFNRITNRMRLVDAFLLTTIAQVGVERAAFFELKENSFKPLAAKGLDLGECFPVPRDETAAEPAGGEIPEQITETARFFKDPVTVSKISQLGFSWVMPMIIFGDLRALVMIGKPIKKSLDDDSFEVFRILVRQAAVAYENTSRFIEESDRTLGLVQTLISLIEENTLARGNTALIANYSYLVAKSLHYPEEKIRDLLFGIMLRDIGMIKVSDLIVRSPRQLVQEEWEIIKRHPLDGAEMLRKMKFSEHAIQIVIYHHERYNGEGYPKKLSHSQIPLGARIVSVVESYGAMLQDRPTRPALTPEEALNTLKENWGNRYDPEIVARFVEIIEEEIRTGERHHLPSMELFKV
jgi:HD-GYP domain-containing protein (c-di-GMP phosphodiesterase class II)